VAFQFSSNPFALAVTITAFYLYFINAYPGFHTDGSKIFLSLAKGSEIFACLYALSLPASVFPLTILLLSVF
jgi:hypothetical protein